MGANMSIDESLKQIEGAVALLGTMPAHVTRGTVLPALESLAALREQLATLTTPPAVPEWEALVRLAYADDGDGVIRYRITAEYNRVREQVTVLTAERDHLDSLFLITEGVTADGQLLPTKESVMAHIREQAGKIATLEAAAKERDARVERMESALREIAFHLPTIARRDGNRRLVDIEEVYGLKATAANARPVDPVADLRAALSPTSIPSTKTAEAAPWRVGSKVPVNLYRADQVMGQCQTPEIAAEIAARMNAGR